MVMMGTSQKPPHAHCHHCDAVARMEYDYTCSACGASNLQCMEGPALVHYTESAMRWATGIVATIADIPDNEIFENGTQVKPWKKPEVKLKYRKEDGIFS